MIKSRILGCFLMVASLSLGGCADWERHAQSKLPVPTPAYADKSIVVAPTRSLHVVNFADGSSKLSDNESAYLESFIDGTSVRRGGTVLVEHPSARLRLAHARATSIESWLKRNGYDVRQVKASGVQDGTVRVMVDHLMAMAPNCPNWAVHPYESFGVQTSSNMGCADRTNLAAMVANPRDLISGNVATPPSGAAVLWSQYRYNTDTTRVLQRESAGGN